MTYQPRRPKRDDLLKPEVISRPKEAKKTKGRRFGPLNAFNDHVKRHLRASEVTVWLSLWRHADRRNQATLSITRIAEECGLAYRTVQKAMQELRRTGLVKTLRKGCQNHAPGKYRLEVNVDNWSGARNEEG